MENVMTDAGFSHRKPLYSFKNNNNNDSSNDNLTEESENGFIKATEELTLRRNKPATRRTTNSNPSRRPRHSSAPDLSFGGKVDLSLLEVNRYGDLMRDYNEKPLKPGEKMKDLFIYGQSAVS